MIKICTIDLDGTLYDQQKNISKENKKAIALAIEKGCKIVLASGRPANGVQTALETLDLFKEDDYVICYNGAKIVNTKKNQAIYTSTISGKVVKEAYLESKRLGLFFHAFRADEQLITDQMNPYTDVEININHIQAIVLDPMTIADDDEFLKCMIVGPEDGITHAMKQLNPYFFKHYSVVRSSKIFLEILNPKTNKGTALVALAQYLHIPMTKTMAIGDAGNDLEMILKAHVGVAMENSFEEVKKAANYITASNEDSGVAKAIHQFIL